MADRTRWAVALVVLVGVAGFLVNVFARHVNPLVALAASAVIVLLSVGMMFRRMITFRSPKARPREQPRRDVDLATARPLDLLTFATHVSNRIREWMAPELGNE